MVRLSPVSYRFGSNQLVVSYSLLDSFCLSLADDVRFTSKTSSANGTVGLANSH